MSRFSHHAYRPLFYRTTRPWWRRLARPAAAFLAVALLTLATSWLIARMEATDAQLRAAHAAGMAVGMSTCPGL